MNVLTPPTALNPAEQELAARAREAGLRADGPEPAPGDAASEDVAARRALEAITEAGLTAHVVPGATGTVSVREICVIRESLAYGSGMADLMLALQGLGSMAVALAGSGQLKTRYLPGVAAGQTIAAFALTEPEAGSDIASLKTSAKREGDSYLLDGAKTFISNAGLADFYTLFARTSAEGKPREGITAFVVDRSAAGFKVKRRLTVASPHPIGELELSGCRVPASHRLGEEGSGLDLAMRVLERFRPTVGAAACGFARRALDESLARSRARAQFGKPLSDLQAIRFKLADMAMWLDASRLLVMRAASLLDRGLSSPDSRRASAMAKLYATEAAQRIVDEAVQIHGGLGVTRGHVVERLYREIRSLRIDEGTSEIQRSIIARAL